MRIHDANCEKQLQAWFAGSRARLLLQREHALLRDVLPSLTGVRLLQVGAWALGPTALHKSATMYQWRLTRRPERRNDIGYDGVNFPIASGSIDALLLAHTLDLSADPHRVLRECERVLSDRGHLVVLGFNPFSMWALAQRLPRQRGTGFVRGARFYSAHRLNDWLRLLGFEPDRVIRYGVGFPFVWRGAAPVDDRSWQRWAAAARLAQAYLVVARKRVIPLTPKPWHARKPSHAAPGRIGLANHGAGRVDSGR